MSLHEHGLLLRNLHVDSPELVKEFLIPGDQVGKSLCQHPRGCQGYFERETTYQSVLFEEGWVHVLLSALSFVHAV